MTIVISSIVFDHGRGQSDSYTVPLRYNETVSVVLPEWQRGMQLPSVAAYLRDQLPPIATVFVRLAATPDEPRWLEFRARATGSQRSSPEARVLPDLPPVRIGFGSAGDSGWCGFPLDTSLMATGVNAASEGWVWQVRRFGAANWIDFDQTHHQTYVLLSSPTQPWLVRPAVPGNRSLPRTDVLDFACSWARGARNEVEAATQITKSVNRLGGERLTYDAQVGAPNYTILGASRFLCDEFLERLRGGEGAGPLVNCSDCATIVSTFANIVGADLWQSKMGLVNGGFLLNPVLAIGGQEWSTVWGGFTFHEVAWSGDCGEQDTVYDACIHLDGDPDPTQAPHVPILPANQVFGAPSSGQYRDLIAAPPDRAKCVPQPVFRDRRAISSQAITFTSDLAIAAPRALALRAEFERTLEASGDEYVFEGFFFFGHEFLGWRLAKAASFLASKKPISIMTSLPVEAQSQDPTHVTVSQWQSEGNRLTRLRVETLETASASLARQSLLRVASEIESPDVKSWDRGIRGETALRSPNGAFAAFTCGNLVHVVRSAGRDVVDVSKAADDLNEWLLHPATAMGGQGPTWRRYKMIKARPAQALSTSSPAIRSMTQTRVGDAVVSGNDAMIWQRGR